MDSRLAVICAIVGTIWAVMGSTVSAAVASNIIQEWASVKPPAAPELKPMTVDPKNTALLMIDFMNYSFGKRPRCLASLPAIKKLLEEARAGSGSAMHGLNVIVPVDGMCSAEAFAEQYVARHMTHAPRVSSKVTLTRTGMTKF